MHESTLYLVPAHSFFDLKDRRLLRRLVDVLLGLKARSTIDFPEDHVFPNLQLGESWRGAHNLLCSLAPTEEDATDSTSSWNKLLTSLSTNILLKSERNKIKHPRKLVAYFIPWSIFVVLARNFNSGLIFRLLVHQNKGDGTWETEADASERERKLYERQGIKRIPYSIMSCGREVTQNIIGDTSLDNAFSVIRRQLEYNKFTKTEVCESFEAYIRFLTSSLCENDQQQTRQVLLRVVDKP